MDIDATPPKNEGQVWICDPALLPEGTYTHCHFEEGSGVQCKTLFSPLPDPPLEKADDFYGPNFRRFSELRNAAPKPRTKCAELADDDYNPPFGMAMKGMQPESDRLRIQWDGLLDASRFLL